MVQCRRRSSCLSRVDIQMKDSLLRLDFMRAASVQNSTIYRSDDRWPVAFAAPKVRSLG